MSPGTAHGRCYCGRVRFEGELPTKFVTHCHCENCRRAHGAAFVTWAGFRAGMLRVTAGEQELRRYVTDTGATRSFCATCGTTLFFESPRWKDEVHVAAVHFEDELDKPPGGHFYADRAVVWCPITDDLPRFGGADGGQRLP